ncbi:MAG: hypothetical protein RL365_467 [Bacteroidota bacterium]
MMYDVQAKSAVRMHNGNYLVVGTQAYANGFLTVHTPQGQAFQETYLSQGALSSYSEFNQITKINDTLAVIGGKISIAVGATEVWQGISMAVNQQGQALWTLTHSISDPSMDASVRDIERLNDTTMLVLTSSIGNASNALSEVDLNGNVNWTKAYNLNTDGFQLNDLCIANSNIYACGNQFDLGTFSGVILKLDSIGNAIEGNKYDHVSQPDFIQSIAQQQGLILANRGHAMNNMDLIMVEYGGNITEQKTFQNGMGGMGMPEEQASKPLQVIDSVTCWYWQGGDFGTYANKISTPNLLPIQTLMHMGNIQRMIEQDTLVYMLSSGPLFGVKNQIVMQKHYALSAVDSVEQFYNYCTYLSNENPLNEIAPNKTTFAPTVTNGPSPSLLFYPLNSNEPWVNEPFCVEMLGGLDEENLKFGPNPCDEEFHIDGNINQPYTIFSIDGKLIQQGKIDHSGYIRTSKLASGNYLIKVSNNSIKVAIKH